MTNVYIIYVQREFFDDDVDKSLLKSKIEPSINTPAYDIVTMMLPRIHLTLI